MTAVEMQQEALSRARGGMSVMNYAAIIRGFAAKGIPEDAILPRVNVLTFHAWKALGRSVKKGEHGVKVGTYVPFAPQTDAETGESVKGTGGSRPRVAVVFHESQTEIRQ